MRVLQVQQNASVLPWRETPRVAYSAGLPSSASNLLRLSPPHVSKSLTLDPLQDRMTLFQSKLGSVKAWIGLAFGSSPVHVIQNAQVLLETGQFAPQTVTTLGGKFYQVSERLPALALWIRNRLNHPIRLTDARGNYMTPGLIDQHNHGALGVDLMTASPQAIHGLMKKLPAYGVTGIAATMVTAPKEEMAQAIHRVEQAIATQGPKETRLLGLHLEGPFLNKGYNGTHNPAWMLEPSINAMTGLNSPSLRLVSLAPELDQQARLTNYLVSRGVRVLAGHTGANFQQMKQATDAGLTGVTHLYNRMPALHHRDPGVIGAALTLPSLKSEVIADGAHVHPSVLQFTLQSRPKDMILVTDSMYLAGLPDGQSGMMGGKKVISREGKVYDEALGCDPKAAGSLAGSAVILNQCVKNVTRWGLTNFATAVQMASKNPADFMGLSQVGRLKANAFADFVLWDPKTLEVNQTYIGGNKVYQRAAV